jgi:hypothetical protein
MNVCEFYICKTTSLAHNFSLCEDGLKKLNTVNLKKNSPILYKIKRLWVFLYQ